MAGVLYSGYAAITGYLVYNWIRYVKLGYGRANALPRGYNMSLIGSGLFFGAGIGDLVWHSIFGVEVDVDALYSPPHLILAMGGGMIGISPFLSALNHKNQWRNRDWIGQIPAIISLIGLISVLTFFTQDTHPFKFTYASYRYSENDSFTKYVYELIGVSGIIIAVITMMIPLLLVLKEFTLPKWSFFLIFSINTLLVVSQIENWDLIIIGVTTGFILDLIYVQMFVSIDNPKHWQIFASFVPLTYFALYFSYLILFEVVVWSIHLVLGSIALASFFGWFLSLLALNSPSIDLNQE